MPVVMVSERKVPVQQNSLQFLSSLAFHRLLKITLQVFVPGRPHSHSFSPGVRRESITLLVAYVPHFQCLREPSDREHNLVQLEQVFRISSIPIKQVPVLGISVLKYATDQINSTFSA